MTLPSITFDPKKIAALTKDERAIFEHHLHRLPVVLHLSGVLIAASEQLQDDDIVIDCNFCCGPDSDAWFQQNYGPVWQAAKFFTCGWPGLDCGCGGAGGGS